MKKGEVEEINAKQRAGELVERINERLKTGIQHIASKKLLFDIFDSGKFDTLYKMLPMLAAGVVGVGLAERIIDLCLHGSPLAAASISIGVVALANLFNGLADMLSGAVGKDASKTAGLQEEISERWLKPGIVIGTTSAIALGAITLFHPPIPAIVSALFVWFTFCLGGNATTLTVSGAVWLDLYVRGSKELKEEAKRLSDKAKEVVGKGQKGKADRLLEGADELCPGIFKAKRLNDYVYTHNIPWFARAPFKFLIRVAAVVGGGGIGLLGVLSGRRAWRMKMKELRHELFRDAGKWCREMSECTIADYINGFKEMCWYHPFRRAQTLYGSTALWTLGAVGTALGLVGGHGMLAAITVCDCSA
jgi:hypothetical protein